MSRQFANERELSPDWSSKDFGKNFGENDPTDRRVLRKGRRTNCEQGACIDQRNGKLESEVQQLPVSIHLIEKYSAMLPSPTVEDHGKTLIR